MLSNCKKTDSKIFLLKVFHSYEPCIPKDNFMIKKKLNASVLSDIGHISFFMVCPPPSQGGNNHHHPINSIENTGIST